MPRCARRRWARCDGARSPSRRCPRSGSPVAASPRHPLARLAFLGTPTVAAATLEALAAAGHEVVGVVTAPDRRRARRAAPSPSPVKQVALARDLPVLERPEDLVELGADLGVVVAYGALVRPPVLARLSLVNVHFSLLPRWRGAAPVEWAILAGDEETGVCLMALEAGLDTGPVYARAATSIGADETAAALTERLGALGISLLLERLAAPPESLGEPVAQAGESTYARKLTPADLELDFDLDASYGARQVRCGRAWTTFRSRRLLVHGAHPSAETPGAPGQLVGDRLCFRRGCLVLEAVQEEGRARLSFDEWRAGARPTAGERATRTGARGDDGAP